MLNSNKYQDYNLIKSFKYAIRGAMLGISTEPSSKIQTALVIFFVTLNILFEKYEFALFHLMLGLMVLSQEVMNTSIEHICDMITLEYNEKIKKIKDLAAGSVFLLAVAWGVLIILNIYKLWL